MFNILLNNINFSINKCKVSVFSLTVECLNNSVCAHRCVYIGYFATALNVVHLIRVSCNICNKF